MKSSSILFAALVVAGACAATFAGAAVPPVDPNGRPALTVCSTTLAAPVIYHFDKVIFQIGVGDLVPVLAADQAALKALPRSTELDIKIIDNPKTVADLKGKVLTFLGAQNSAANRNLIKIAEVEYASVVCPKAP